MIQPGHYLTHAIPSVSESVSVIKRPTDQRVLAEALAQAIRSEKFVLPDGGMIVERWGANLPDDPRLPFTSIVIEFAQSEFTWENEMHRSSRRIALCTEIENNGLIKDTQSEHAICVMSIYYADGLGKWLAVPWLGVITMEPISAPMLTEREKLTDKAQHLPAPNASGFVPVLRVIPWLEEWAKAHADAVGYDQAVKSATDDLRHECAVVMSLIEALACSNVSTDTITAPVKLNRKRAASGKIPFFDYRVLTIHAGARPERGHPGDGTHASPRLHLRRGHIRRLASGKTTFVRPHFVGDPERGEIAKDYRVTA